MGKRKSRVKLASKKCMSKLDTVFCCPFCNHSSGVKCLILIFIFSGLKSNIGEANCRIFQESFSSAVNALTEPIDVKSLPTVHAETKTPISAAAIKRISRFVRDQMTLHGGGWLLFHDCNKLVTEPTGLRQ